MSVFLFLFLVTVLLPYVFCQQEQGDCFGAGSVAGAAIGAFLGALLLIAAIYYLRKIYLRKTRGKHLVLSTDPENVKDEFAFDNPGFKHEERQGWQHDAPTLPVGGKNKPLHAEFVKPDETKDDIFLHRGRVRRVKLWARDFTGLGLKCCGGAREGVHIHSLLRSGPAAAAKLQPGDKIKSIKIEFSGTPLEDAINIMSLASPYPVELEVIEGGRVSGEGRGVMHPLMKKAGSMGDVTTLERESKHLHPPKSPKNSHSNNSTLENKQAKGGIKKIITDKIITSTLERSKNRQPSTLERENEKNIKINKSRFSDVPLPSQPSKPDKVKTRYSVGSELQGPPENGHVTHYEHSEIQKRENDPKRAMKFGIRVLPPNVPDDGVLRQKSVENETLSLEKKIVDETDRGVVKTIQPTMRHENEVEQRKPVVAKRREKMAPPIPNARVKINDSDLNTSNEINKISENSFSTFARNDLNSSGIKRDENGIPQELPSHMYEAARVARINRKSSSDLIIEIPETKKEEVPKPTKKSKGKAPSPPDTGKNKTDDSILEQLNNVHDFLNKEKQHSSLLHDSSYVSMDKSFNSINTSTPKNNKIKSQRIDDSLTFSQDDIDDIVSKPFKRESDSLNNYYEDSRSNISSNHDVTSVLSLNQSDRSDKGSTTIELNNSDITIHSSPNDTVLSVSDDTSTLDENERKAASLGDLSRFELKTKANKSPSGTLERAQSLDISADDPYAKDNPLSPKKRKAMSVVETTFFESSGEDVLPDMIDSAKGIMIKHKEPRLSLNIAKSSAMEGLSTFQNNRLKKGSEFGNLEDAIVKGSNSSLDYDKKDKSESQSLFDMNKNLPPTNEPHETSDHLARRIMDENMKVHLKLVSEFAKTTSDGSNMSSLDSSRDVHSPIPSTDTIKYEEKVTYDTNIPDDLKVSRNSYVNSLERPKSELMKKLLAKNPILNVHIDNSKNEASPNIEVATPMTDASKSAIHQPDIVNFDLKTDTKPKDYGDFVSNIRVGSSNNSTNVIKPEYNTDNKKSKIKNVSNSNNIVTISTNEKVDDEKSAKDYTKSIEIREPTRRLIPDVIDGIKRRSEEFESRTLYMEPGNVAITMTQEPTQKTVTVNVAEDEFGNKVITQNIEKVSTAYSNPTAEAPIQVEQVTFGLMKNPDKIDQFALEEGNIDEFDKKVLNEIKHQNPNIHFTSDEPAFTKSETIILSTNMDEKEAVALMERLKNDPSFMAQKTPEELSKLGIRILRDLEDIKHESHDTIEVSKTSYTINPNALFESPHSDSEIKNDHITEIQVLTPKTEKSQNKDKISNTQRILTLDEKTTYELDVDLTTDFIENERHHTDKQNEERRTKDIEPKKRHSDFDLPRNSHIKFRTATYESPKGTIVTSTDLENRRLSQLDQMHLRSNDATKPVISAKPSSIPVKTPEKQKVVVPSSKIPILSQKSLSQENLNEKMLSIPHSPPPKLSSSSGNISITSIKSSSKHPSGK